MSERISINIIFNEKLSVLNAKDWFQSMNYFIPLDMTCKNLTKGKFQKYNQERFYKNIDIELSLTNNNIMIKDTRNSISISTGNNGILLFSCILECNIFNENKNNILSRIDENMINHKGIVAYSCSLEDSFWQHNEDIQMYELRGKSLCGIRMKKSYIFPNEDIVDIEFNPGHSHIVDKIWFGSCWAMWYGKEYYKYIPKEILSSYTNCYDNKEIGNDCIRVTLYENPWDYEKKENRAKQAKFRKSVGVDEVAHRLENTEKVDADFDESIEILEGNFEHGGIRIIQYYYDREGELTVKSQAIESRKYELGEKGDLLWKEIKKLT